MTTEELEAKVKALEDKVASREKAITTLQDVEKIKRLQRSYGYYIEHWMVQEIIDLFADGPDVSLTLGAGMYVGKEGVKRYFNRHKGTPADNNPEFMHQVMQLSPIVTVDPDGRTAKGQFYGFGAAAIPVAGKVVQSFFSGIYGGEYVKEDGVWKIKKLRFDQWYNATPLRGWVAPERLAGEDILEKLPDADIPRSFSVRYPSGYIFRFHYKHPVTGKETSEGARDAAITGGKDL